jgi:hypothetical protein
MLPSTGPVPSPLFIILSYLTKFNHKVTKHDFHKLCHFVRPVSAPQERKQLSCHAPLPPSPPLPNIFASHVVQTCGRLRKNHSTRRNPSAFEPTAGTQVHRPGRVGGESFPVNLILLGFTQQLAHHLTGA